MLNLSHIFVRWGNPRIALIFSAVILFAATFYYPFPLLLPFEFSANPAEFIIFRNAIVTATCLGILFLIRFGCLATSHKAELVLSAAGLYLLMAIFNFIADTHNQFDHLLFSLTWLCIPLAALALGEPFRRQLPAYISFIWLVNGLHCLWQFSQHREIIGIAGNRNWNGSLVLATTPVFIVWLAGRMRSVQRRKKRDSCSQGRDLILSPKAAFLLFLPIVAYSLVVIYKAHSRGTWLAMLVCFVIVLVRITSKRHLMKVLFICAAAPVLIGVIAVAFSAETTDILFSDVRIPLWTATLNLIRAQPMGCGLSAFEGAIAPFKPIGYFLRDYATLRTNHPHNQLLYITAGLGIIGGLAWLWLWMAPLLFLWRKFNLLDQMEKVIYFSYAALLFQGMLDLIIFAWPTLFIACFYLGYLWFTVLRIKRDEPNPGASYHSWHRLLYHGSFLLGLLIFSYVGIVLFHQFKHAYSHRQIFISQGSNRASHTMKKVSDAIRNNPYDEASIYMGATVAMMYHRDPKMALYYFSMLDETPMRQLANSNSHTAQCLLALKRKNDALRFLKQQVKLYPISVVALYNLYRLQLELGHENDANHTLQRLDSSLKFKGLTAADLPYLLENPKYDLKFRTYLSKKAETEI